MLSGLLQKELFKEREVWRKTLLVKIIVTLVTQGLLVYFPLLECTQHDGRKKKGLCVTNMTGLLIACFVVIFTNINAFRSFTKRTV